LLPHGNYTPDITTPGANCKLFVATHQFTNKHNAACWKSCDTFTAEPDLKGNFVSNRQLWKTRSYKLFTLYFAKSLKFRRRQARNIAMR